MKYQKENVIKTLFKIIPHTKKILRNKPDQGDKRFKCWKQWNNNRENWRWFKEMERYSKVFDRKELKLLKWSYYPKQPTYLMWSLSNYTWYFHRTRTNNPKIYMEPQKTQNIQNNPEGKEQSRRHNLSRPSDITKPQESKWHNIDPQTDIWMNGTKQTRKTHISTAN